MRFIHAETTIKRDSFRCCFFSRYPKCAPVGLPIVATLRVYLHTATVLLVFFIVKQYPADSSIRRFTRNGSVSVSGDFSVASRSRGTFFFTVAGPTFFLLSAIYFYGDLDRKEGMFLRFLIGIWPKTAVHNARTDTNGLVNVAKNQKKVSRFPPLFSSFPLR